MITLSKSRVFQLSLATVIAAALACAGGDDAEAFKRKVRKKKPVPNWYIGLAGSVNFVQDSKYVESGGIAPITGTLEYDEGYGMSGAIGYRARYANSALSSVRFEAELALRDNEMDQVISTAGATTTLSDDLQVQTAMANVYLDFNLHSSWHPYVGGGLGIARIHMDSTDFGIDDEDTVFAYQGMVGMFYTPSSFPAAEFGVGYRYLGTTDPEFVSSTFGTTAKTEYDSHNLEVNTRFYF